MGVNTHHQTKNQLSISGCTGNQSGVGWASLRLSRHQVVVALGQTGFKDLNRWCAGDLTCLSASSSIPTT
jgi:hypothetical protein